jgi:hypothetical protein
LPTPPDFYSAPRHSLGERGKETNAILALSWLPPRPQTPTDKAVATHVSADGIV